MNSNSTPKSQQKSSFLHYPATPTISSKNMRSPKFENDCSSVPIMVNLDPSERISLNTGRNDFDFPICHSLRESRFFFLIHFLKDFRNNFLRIMIHIFVILIFFL